MTTATSPSRSRRAMIEAHGMVKRYGSTMAVSDLSFPIRPGASPSQGHPRTGATRSITKDGKGSLKSSNDTLVQKKLGDVVEVAELDAGHEFLPFSPRIYINRTIWLGGVAEHH